MYFVLVMIRPQTSIPNAWVLPQFVSQHCSFSFLTGYSQEVAYFHLQKNPHHDF